MRVGEVPTGESVVCATGVVVVAPLPSSETGKSNTSNEVFLG